VFPRYSVVSDVVQDNEHRKVSSLGLLNGHNSPSARLRCGPSSSSAAAGKEQLGGARTGGRGMQGRGRGLARGSSQLRSCFAKKSGQCNVVFSNLEEKGQRYLADLFTTCVDLHWRYLLLLFCTGSLLSWLFFRVIFYLVSLAHGDFQGPPGASHGAAHPPTPPCMRHTPCLLHVQGFLGALLFSME